MSIFDDSFDEMNNDEVTSDTAERLLGGDFDSLAHADIAAVVSDIRGLSARVPTPTPSSALSEFVGVGLTPNDIPAGTPVTDVDLRSPNEVTPVRNRRNSVFAQIAAFAGTMGGKVALTGAVAAASVTGAHATGAVDVPGLPDRAVAVETIETELVDESVEFAEIEAPEALSFTEDRSAESDTDKVEDQVEPAEKTVVDPPEAKSPVKTGDEVDELEKKESDEKHVAEKVEAKAKESAEAKEKAELEAKLAAEEEAELEAKKKAEAAEQAELEAKKKAEAEENEKSTETKKDEPKTEAEYVAYLESKLEADKAAVREWAKGKITYYEGQLAEKRESLKKELDKVDDEYAGYIADIDAQIEASENDGEVAELKAYRELKQTRWDNARAEVELWWAECIEEVETSLDNVEVERDAEIVRLELEFDKAVEAAKK